MQLDSFSIVTEFAVALAGFSGVAVAIASRGSTLGPLLWFRNLTMLCWALSAAFASVFPHVLANLGIEGEALWAAGSAMFAVVLVALSSVPITAARRLTPEDRAGLRTYMWILALGGNAVLLLWQVANMLALFAAPSPGPITAGAVYLLFFSALLFVRMLASPPEATSD